MVLCIADGLATKYTSAYFDVSLKIGVFTDFYVHYFSPCNQTLLIHSLA